MKKKKRKYIFFIIVIIAILTIFAVINSNKTSKASKEIEELLKKQNVVFYSAKKSEENGFKTDIMVEFKYKPIESNGNPYSNKYYYDQLINETSKKIDGNYRLIDNKDKLIVRVINNKGYTINGQDNYFESELKRIEDETYGKAPSTTIKIRSEELNKIINSNWALSSINVQGIEHEKIDNLEKYKFNGYEVIADNSKIYNITFNKDYRSEVLEGIQMGLLNTQVKQVLGEPLINNFDAEIIIGYKAQNSYVFFYDGSISFYAIDSNPEEICTYEAKKDLSKFFVSNDKK